MKKRSIPTPADDHAARAARHRPTDPAAIAAEVRRLRTTGLMARDIAEALRMSLATVIEITCTQQFRGNY